MIVTLDEAKQYLRVDTTEDDALIEALIDAAGKRCLDISRRDTEEQLAQDRNAKIAMLYTIAYLYEHREEADHNALNLSLRALLFSERREIF